MPSRRSSRGSSLEWLNTHWFSKYLEFCNLTLREKRIKHKITQEQIAQKIGIDQSRISRIENSGERPSHTTAMLIAEAYQLTDEESKEWFELFFHVKSTDPAILVDTSDVKNLKGAFDIRSLPEYLDDIELEFKKNQQVLDGGQTRLITKWLEETTIPNLRQKLKQVNAQNGSEAWPIIEYLSLALMQYGQTFVFWQPHLEAAKSLRRCSIELKQLALVSGHPLPNILVYYCLSYADYIAGFQTLEYTSSLKHALLGLEVANSFQYQDPNILHHFYDIKAISYAKLGQKSQTINAENEYKNILEHPSLSPRTVRGGYNTIARVESALGSNKFWEIHENVKKDMQNTARWEEPFNVLINIWAELEAMRLLKTPDRGFLESLTTQAATFSTEDYRRIILAIETEAKRVAEMLEIRLD